LRVGEFFGVPADRLAPAEFADLLQHELADPERFQAVETRIHHARAGLRSVEGVESGREVEARMKSRRVARVKRR
jgi:hypothetical protein